MKHISRPGTKADSQNPTTDQIAVAAYQLYLENGCQDGHDLEHWLRAEEKLKAGAKVQVLEPSLKATGPTSETRSAGTRENPLSRDGSASREQIRQTMTPSRPASRQPQWRTERSAQTKRAA